MNSAAINGMIDLCVSACGVYVFYIWYVMNKTGKIQKGMLLPKDIEPKKCKDTAAYIRAISPKMLILGVCCLLSGILGLIEDSTGCLGPKVYMVAMTILIVCLVWYAVQSKKIVKTYWEEK